MTDPQFPYGYQSPQPREGMPGYPSPAQQPPGSPVERPPPVTLAVRLMYLGAALSLIELILNFLTVGGLTGQVQDELARSRLAFTPGQVEGIVKVSLITTAVAGAISILLWLWMAWKNGQGRSWARVLGTVFGGVDVLSVLAATATGRTTAPVVITELVSVVIAIAIIILMFRKQSSAFYAAASRTNWR